MDDVCLSAMLTSTPAPSPCLYTPPRFDMHRTKLSNKGLTVKVGSTNDIVHVARNRARVDDRVHTSYRERGHHGQNPSLRRDLHKEGSEGKERGDRERGHGESGLGLGRRHRKVCIGAGNGYRYVHC